MGGRVFSDFAFLSHCSSVRLCIYIRRFDAYVVPHGPRHPRRSPVSQSFSGTLPLLMKYPGVWQSLQPPILTRYLPRSSCAEPVVFPLSAAWAIHGAAAATTAHMKRAA